MKGRLQKDSWLFTRPIAHRGLWNSEFGENTLSAYKNAVDNNYPIEMDVQMTKDGVLCCFHDDNLKRVTGTDALINDLTYNEIKHLKISGTNDGIPTFKEFLALVNGKVPLVIEIKQQKVKRDNIAEKVVEELAGYEGEFVVQSFDPFIVRDVRKANPNIIRGQLGGLTERGSLSYPTYLTVKYLLLNFISKPDFVNYMLQAMPVKTSLPTILWTIRTKDDEKKAKKFNKNYIFEGFIPEEN